MLTTSPEIKLKTLFDDNWNAANTSGITPKVHTGWYNTAWNTTCQLTIGDPDESVMDGGETGITAFTGGGDLVRFLFTDIVVAPWAHREMVDSNGDTFNSLGINPKTLVYQMSNEIRRIVNDNMFSDSELEFMTWLQKNRVVNTRVKPVVFSYNNMIRLSYRETF